MKRIGYLFERVVERDNLRLAFWKASRGKRSRDDQRDYQERVGFELERLRTGLMEGSYPVGDYRRFKVYDPKEREICAAAFGERVLHHALMNVCEPCFEKWLIEETCACRVGRGQKAAIALARRNARRYTWYLKCDIRKYFDSISQVKLKELLASKFKDPRILFWFGRIIDTYEVVPGKGLPIGNLTSQHFANLYLDRLDRFVKQRFHGYVRYMDDFVIWSDNRDKLLAFRSDLASLLKDELDLAFKQVPVLQRCAVGMDFLGMRVFPCRLEVARASLSRFKAKARFYARLYESGLWNEAALQDRMTALTAFLRQADSCVWRRNFFRQWDEDLGCRRGTSGSNRVLRGGSWNNNANNCASSYRNNNNPSNENNNNGFRLSCSPASSGLRRRQMIPAGILSVGDHGENPSPAAAGRPVDAALERRGGTPSLKLRGLGELGVMQTDSASGVEGLTRSPQSLVGIDFGGVK